MNTPNEIIEGVVEAALATYLRYRAPFSSEGEPCEVTCGGFRAKVYGGGDATIRIVIYEEPDLEVLP
jgi:hypothetical protein